MQRILRQLKPILGGLPLIGVLFVLSLVLAKQIIKYSPTRYLTIAKIKLDTRKYGVSNDMLYKDFDIFTSENKIETEAEILGSHLLIKRALSKVEFNNQIKRIGACVSNPGKFIGIGLKKQSQELDVRLTLSFTLLLI